MKRTLLAVAGCLALVAVGCSSEPEGPDTFDATITVAGNSDGNFEDSCAFEEGAVGVDTAVVLRGADGRILGKQNLVVVSINEYTPGAGEGPCTFEAVFDVPVGDAGYDVSIDGIDFVPVVYTEAELREGPVISLTNKMGAALDAISGR